MNKEIIDAAAVDFFIANPTAKEVFGTSDGQLFARENHAWAHARTIDKQNPSIEKYSKDIAAKVDADPKAAKETTTGKK
jgi:hypothetical protein